MTVDTSTQSAEAEARLKAYYGEFTSEREKAALSVPLRLVAAWGRNDAAGMAQVCTDDSTRILPGDVYKCGRDEIHAFMAAAFAGPFKGTGVTGRPVDVRFVGDDVALLRTHGGILAPGETEIEPELAGVDPNAFVRITSDVGKSVSMGLGAIPAMMSFRAEIVERVPQHPIELLDKLQDYALAAWSAHILAAAPD